MQKVSVDFWRSWSRGVWSWDFCVMLGRVWWTEASARGSGSKLSSFYFWLGFRLARSLGSSNLCLALDAKNLKIQKLWIWTSTNPAHDQTCVSQGSKPARLYRHHPLDHVFKPAIESPLISRCRFLLTSQDAHLLLRLQMLFDCPITKDDVINCINSLASPKTSNCENYYSRKEKQFVSESIRGSMARLFRETFQFFDCASLAFP